MAHEVPADLTMMKATIWKVSGSSPVGDAACAALRAAGIGLLEKDNWDDVAAALLRGEATLVVADAQAVSDLTAARSEAPAAPLPREQARELAHQLRTPLSAMAGWLHLMESGALDQAGVKRAITKLQANVDDQVRTIEKYLGAKQEGPH